MRTRLAACSPIAKVRCGWVWPEPVSHVGWGTTERESWTASEGLPGSNVQAIHRDASGVLWVGTEDGLHRRSRDDKSWAQ
ncbi:MAG: hypothetical protein DMG58_21260 [Acidobacteria bacterium]|nr:MAG: hypothetical protein DMG58_21260 [Acidobacteriota bacterium]